MTMRNPGTDRRRAVLDALTPVVEALGFDLEDVAVTAAGKRSLVRLTVDSDDGVDLDQVAVVARAVSDTLDEAEQAGRSFFAGAYVLEVSSPGVDRPLTEPRHWRRARGRLVATTAAGEPFQGRVESVDENAGTVAFVVDGSEPLTHPLASLGPGRVQVEFARLSESDGGDEDGATADFDDDLNDDEHDEVEG